MSTQALLLSTRVDMASVQAALVSSQVSQASTEAALVSTQASLMSTQMALVSTQSSTQAALSSLQADLLSTQAELSNVGETVCNQPVCSAGTQSANGTCVPDCPDLRRRGIQCEPFCDDGDIVTPNNGNGGDGSDNSTSSTSSMPTWLVVAITLGVVLVIITLVVAVQRARQTSNQTTHEKARPKEQHTMTMFMNPIHQGYDSRARVGAETHDDFQEPSQDVKLDPELYVQPPPSTDEGVYSVFKAPAAVTPASDVGADQGTYSLFRAPADGRARATEAPTHSLFRSPDSTV